MNRSPQDPYRPASQLDHVAAARPSNVAWITAIVLWIGLTIKFIAAATMITPMFEDLGIEMPLLTLWLLHPLAAPLLLATVLGIIVAGVMSPEKRKPIGRLALALWIPAFLATVVGLLLPLMKVIQNLS